MNVPHLLLALASTLAISLSHADDLTSFKLVPITPTTEESIAQQLALVQAASQDSDAPLSSDLSFSNNDSAVSSDSNLAAMYEKAVQAEHRAFLKRVQISAHLAASRDTFLVLANQAFEAQQAQEAAEASQPGAADFSLPSSFAESLDTELTSVPFETQMINPLDDAAAAPEPATWILFGLGGLGLAIYRWKQTRKPVLVPVQA